MGLKNIAGNLCDHKLVASALSCMWIVARFLVGWLLSVTCQITYDVIHEGCIPYVVFCYPYRKILGKVVYQLLQKMYIFQEYYSANRIF